MVAIPHWLINLTSVVSNISIAVAAIIGIIGLWQWRTELVGKTKFEVARKITLLALQFRDEYGRARNPWTFRNKSIERVRLDNESPEETRVLDEYYARSRRLQPLQDTLRKFYEASWEAEVILSKDDAKLVELFEKFFDHLYIAVDFHFEEVLKQARKQSMNTKEDYEAIRANKKIIYGIRDDEIYKSVDAATETVKKQLKKYIR